MSLLHLKEIRERLEGKLCLSFLLPEIRKIRIFEFDQGEARHDLGMKAFYLSAIATRQGPLHRRLQKRREGMDIVGDTDISLP